MRTDCPYDIPRRNEVTGLVSKCDMCIDRVKNDMVPMCVKTCCSGTMNFGERADMLRLAKERLAEVRKEFPEARLGDVDDVAVIYLMAFPPERYAENAVAMAPAPLNRQQLLARLASPLRAATRG
jgi:formate dehydrogenase iron-sulfur subunit